jgi:light-regulated signal transduction histidine kinase (bacteriophytochrome)
LRSAIDESEAVVTYGPLPVVIADPDQLVDVFQNLIGNAIKYQGDRKPRVHVSASNDGRNHIFSVKDNGIGIGADFHDRIFDMFQRLHLQDVYSGTGIGLTLCKRIVERHGGQIWVKSTPGEGSEFFFSIPSEGQDEQSSLISTPLSFC